MDRDIRTKQIITGFVSLNLLGLMLVGCQTRRQLAPVTSINRPSTALTKHITQPGETLYSIAWQYGWEYKDLAHYNHLSPPYRLYPGQQLMIKKSLVINSTPGTTPKPERSAAMSGVNFSTTLHWQSPVKSPYRYQRKDKGLEFFLSYQPMPVRAAAGGVVVYSGEGLRGYGKLIIIKHNNDFLTAYAKLSAIYVKAGSHLQPAQVIGLMQANDSNKFYFEVRYRGKPINPVPLFSRKTP